MNDIFKNIADNNSTIVNTIIENAMFHTKKYEARRFLNFMDNYTSYYLNAQNNEGINFPMIRISSCPLWAKEIFLKYLIFRISLFYNSDLREKFYIKYFKDEVIYLKNDKDTREYKKIGAIMRKYVKNLLKCIKDSDSYLGESHHKNLIFCREQDLMVSRKDKNMFIKEFYCDDILKDNNVCICDKISASDILEKLEKTNRNNKIDNIFIFYTNNDSCNSLERTALENLNDVYGTSIKNCFIFDFSEKPFSINKVYRRGLKFTSTFVMLPEKDFKNNSYYTVLNDEESRYLFNKGTNSSHIHIKDENNQHEYFFESMIGSILEETDYPIQERNIFSLCMNQILCDAYIKRIIKLFPEFDGENYEESFDCQKYFAEKIIKQINDFMSIDGTNELALVIDKNISKESRLQIKSMFPTYNVKIYDYSALKPRKKGQLNSYKNGIRENRVVILQYRPHYATRAYPKYPNSFDPFVTNPNQKILDIIQGYCFDDMYLWDKYDYSMISYKYFNSEYRQKRLGGIIKPERPEIKRITGETEFSDESSQNRNGTSSITIKFVDGSTCHLSESDWVLYTINNDREFDIAQIRDIKEDNLLTNISSLQRLDELMEPLSILIEHTEQINSTNEQIIRDKCYEQNLINQEEKDSDIALWKILLFHKTENGNSLTVYNEIMKDIKVNERVHLSTFEKWYDFDNKMILPLQKSCQKRLFEYLGFEMNKSPYLRIMRAKKISVINGSRKKNNIMQEFLINLILSDSNEDIIEKYRDSEINDFLQLKDTEDVDNLKDLIELNNNINLKPVNNINE
jgi:hypothetical protein